MLSTDPNAVSFTLLLPKTFLFVMENPLQLCAVQYFVVLALKAVDFRSTSPNTMLPKSHLFFFSPRAYILVGRPPETVYRSVLCRRPLT